MSRTKICLLNWYFSMKKIQKDSYDFWHRKFKVYLHFFQSRFISPYCPSLSSTQFQHAVQSFRPTPPKIKSTLLDRLRSQFKNRGSNTESKPQNGGSPVRNNNENRGSTDNSNSNDACKGKSLRSDKLRSWLRSWPRSWLRFWLNDLSCDLFCYPGWDAGWDPKWYPS